MDKQTQFFHQHQMDGFVRNIRFCEMDMNAISPITRAVDEKCYNTVKRYVKFLKEFAAKSGDKAALRNLAPIFYGCVKQLIQLQIIDLEEFLNPDGVGEDIGCELFQQTLTQKFLPVFAVSDQIFTNEYCRSMQALERNMGQALMIDEIRSSGNMIAADNDKEKVFEVQYGFIDLDWISMLNVFDQ